MPNFLKNKIVVFAYVFVVTAVISSLSIVAKNKMSVKVKTIEDFEALPKSIRVFDESIKETYEITFDELITRVAVAEMPAVFHIEAIKAQIVAAQTYIINYIKRQNKNQDENFVLPINSNSTLFAEDMEKRRLNWGENFDTYKEKIKNAYKATQSQLLFFDGKVIPAFFHAASFESTNLPSEIFEKGCDTPDGYPYQKVESKCGEYLEKYKKKYQFSKDDFSKILKEKFEVECFGKPEKWIKKIHQSEKNLLISKIEVLSKNVDGQICVISGNKLRSAFGLPSQNIIISYNDGFFNFETFGYGHGIGMSQVGANWLAEKGLNYKQILKHFYPKAKLLKVLSKD